MNGSKNDNGKPEGRYLYLQPLVELATNPGDNTLDELLLARDSEQALKFLIQGNMVRALHHIQLASKYCLSLLKKLESKDPEGNSLINGIVSVSKVGANRYGLFNYQKGIALSRLFDALFRHIFKRFVLNCRFDVESGVDHLYHVLSNLAMIEYNLKFVKESNDLTQESSHESK